MIEAKENDICHTPDGDYQMHKGKWIKLNRDGWISVKDRLPDDRQIVIAYGCRENNDAFCVVPCQFNIYSKHSVFYCLDEYGYAAGDLENVTQWMPLPEKPQ